MSRWEMAAMAGLVVSSAVGVAAVLLHRLEDLGRRIVRALEESPREVEPRTVIRHYPTEAAMTWKSPAVQIVEEWRAERESMGLPVSDEEVREQQAMWAQFEGEA